MKNNIILTGPPRSGTTLACSLLNQLPDTAALHEPMNLKMFPDPAGAVVHTRNFFAQMRTSILETGTALSKVKGAKIPSNPFAGDRSVARKSIVRKGTVTFDQDFSPSFRLVIKQNGHFTFLLPDLADHFPVFVILRHPVATIASWNTIQAPVAQGNLRVLQTLDPILYHRLERVPELVARQVALLKEMYQRYAALPISHFIYYEKLVASAGKALQAISPAAAHLDAPLKNKNHNPLYNQVLLMEIKQQLLTAGDVFLPHYAKQDIHEY